MAPLGIVLSPRYLLCTLHDCLVQIVTDMDLDDYLPTQFLHKEINNNHENNLS